MSQNNTKKYQAFISYRHADNTISGRQWASWLHQAIETYEVPSDLVGQINERGDEIQGRIFPVFRDEEALPADSDLANAITGALDETRVLVILCSPNARASTYVADEIDYFKKLGHSDSIIAAMIDGEPNTSWDTSKHSLGFSEQDECFPVPLQFVYDEKGEPTAKRAEPIAADFRVTTDGKKEQGWTSPQAYREALKNLNTLTKKVIDARVSEYDEQLHLMLLKIIAGILGVPLDDLTQRDKAYQLELERNKAKRLRQWLGAVALLAIVAVGTGVFALKQQQIAEEKEAIAIDERNKVLTTQSNFLNDLSKQELNKGFADIAFLLALNAVPGKYGGERPLIPGLRNQLTIAENKSKLVEFPHRGNVSRASFSSDGHKVVTISNNSIIIWLIKTGEILHTFTHEHSETNEPFASFSPDGSQLLYSSKKNEVTLRSVKSGERLHQYNCEKEQSVMFAHFSPDSRHILVVCEGRFAILLSADTGKEIQRYFKNINTFLRTGAHNYPRNSTTFSPDGSKIAITNDETALIWNIGNREFPHQVFETENSIHAIHFSPDGQRVLTASEEGAAILWAVETGEKIQVFSHDTGVLFAAFNPDGSQVITAAHDNTAVLWSTETGEKLHTFQHENSVVYAQFSPNGRKIITSSWDNTTVVWSADNYWRKQRTFSHSSQPVSTSFSPDSSQVLTADFSGRSTSLWSVNKVKKWTGSSNDENVGEYMFSPNGLYFLKTLTNNSVEIWSVINEKKLQTFKHLYARGPANFSLDGDNLITVPSEKTVSIWSVETGELIKTVLTEEKIHYAGPSKDGAKVIILWSNILSHWFINSGERKDQFHCAYINSDDNEAIFKISGTLLISKTSSSNNINICSLETGKLIQSIIAEDYEPLSIQVSPDGRYLLTLADRTPAVLWSIKTGKQLHSFDQYYGIREAAFGPDSKRLITRTDGTKAILWSLESGNELHILDHNTVVGHINFSPDGRKIISLSEGTNTSGGEAIVWSTKTGEKLQTYDGLLDDGEIRDAIFSPLDKQIMLVSDNSMMLWQVWPDDFQSYAVSKLPKNKTCLTPEERKQYYLTELTDHQWLERGCLQFTKAKREAEDLPIKDDN